METSTAVQKIEIPQASSEIMSVIALAASDPRVDIDKLERLLAMKERMDAETRKTAYMGALARVQAQMPQIAKNGRIEIRGTLQSKYALLEDIDRAVRPLLAAERLSMSFDTDQVEGRVVVKCALAHADGHSETKQLALPIDTSGSKNSTQAIVSTVSYGRRTLTKMFFNLVEAGEDDDANGGALNAKITDNQANDLASLLDEVKGNRSAFLKFWAIEKLVDLPARDLARATVMLEQKRAGR